MSSLKKFIETPMEYANEIPVETLEKYLRKISDAYYNTDESLVSDKIFDELKEILADRDPNNSFLDEIGAPVGRGKIKLPFPMGSLNKIKPDTNELEKWLKNYSGPFELSDKLDGISALLHHSEDGIKFYSRGNGTVGQDITHMLKYIKINTDLIPNETAVRGELIMSKKNFQKIKDQMKNARNAVAGIVNSKTHNETFKKLAKLIDFVTYNVVHPRYKQIDQYKYLEEWGFPVVPHKEVKKLSKEMLMKYFSERREESDYEIDGIVVIDNSVAHDVVVGNPKYGFAFKSIQKDQYTVATVEDVEWDESRYGYLKPRIRIKPISLVGVTITYATAHNAKFIFDNKIGVGSKIKIIRSGDVIPKIMEVISPATDGKPKMPDVPFVWNETKVDILVKDDTDDSKTNIIIKQLTNTMDTLGVKYISEGIITKLVERGYNSLAKILKAKREDIQIIIGDKMTEKIYNNLETALKHTQLHIFMVASNCFGRGLGTRKLHVITKKYPDIMNADRTESELFDEVNLLEGFQEKTTEKFVEGFQKFKKFFDRINKIIDIDYLRKTKKEKSANIFAGQKIVLTGFRDKGIMEFIEKNGGELAGSVSKNTSLVICIDDTEDTSKLTKAKDLGVPIMTKEKFMKKYFV